MSSLERQRLMLEAESATKEARRVKRVRRLEGVRFFVVGVLILFVLGQSYLGRVELVKSQRAGCERLKLDRSVVAPALHAQAEWLDGLIRAWNVPENLKSLARSNQRAQENAAVQLDGRATIDCDVAYPDPSLVGFG